jgi:tripeptide aminopeptidase
MVCEAIRAMTAPFSSPLAETLAHDVLERFLRYVRVDTQSARDRDRSPSTPGQLELAAMLVEELLAIGLVDAAVDVNGYVIATLAGRGPTVGLIAHMDVSPDAPGAGVQPIVHREYDGGVLALPRGETVLDPATMPVLAGKAGHDIVTSSGDTLLGADDKAGVAEIMAAVAHLAAHPELPRPTLRVGFTPDEEVGEGASLFPSRRSRRWAPTRSTGRSRASCRTRRSAASRSRSRSPASTFTPAGRRTSSSTPLGSRLASSPRCRPTR